MATPTVKHVEEIRAGVRDLRAALAKLRELNRDWNVGYGTWVNESKAEGGDFEQRDGLEKRDIAAALSSFAAVDAFITKEFHDTNFLKVQ